ncbi:ABC transporter ATP-binding protein, partial [Vibrio sp. 704]|nr:ABC transporter ATP-binding protein [Vibrio sp. 704]
RIIVFEDGRLARDFANIGSTAEKFHA